jgi:hypothetical protein
MESKIYFYLYTISTVWAVISRELRDTAKRKDGERGKD